MNDDELLSAFSKIIEESISTPAIRSKINREISEQLKIRGSFPAKHFLATISQHSDTQASDESKALIKEIFYYYG